MPRFAANISLLFQDRPILKRALAARDCGFGAVEMLFPYAHPVTAWREALHAAQMPLVLINTSAGDWDAGERGCAAIPGCQEAFRKSFLQALEYASALDVPFVHVMAGLATGARAQACFVDNLRWALARAGDQRLTIEPINPVDMPGYFLNDFDQAAAIIDTLDDPRLGLQFDAYHAHRITGDMRATWERFRTVSCHVQVADPVGRHEPLGDTIDFPGFFAALDAGGYTGTVSGEYFPAARTEDGLEWLRYPGVT